MAGRLTKYAYDSAGNLTSITYPDGRTSSFGYDASHRLTSVTNPDGYGFKYEYKNDFRVPRVSRIAEYGSGNKAGQEMKVSYANGNTTVFETPDWTERLHRPEITGKSPIISTTWGARPML